MFGKGRIFFGLCKIVLLDLNIALSGTSFSFLLSLDHLLGLRRFMSLVVSHLDEGLNMVELLVQDGSLVFSFGPDSSESRGIERLVIISYLSGCL